MNQQEKLNKIKKIDEKLKRVCKKLDKSPYNHILIMEKENLLDDKTRIYITLEVTEYKI